MVVAENKSISPQVERNLNILTVLFISYALNLVQILREAITNITPLGAYIRPLSLYCVIIPVIYLGHISWKMRGSIRLPYLGWMGLLIAVQVFTEVMVYVGGGEPKLIMVQRHLLPYGVFLYFVNLHAVSNQMCKRVLDLAIACLLCFVAVIYIGYLGILDLGTNILTGEISIFSSRPHDAIYHPNYVSYLLVALLAFLLARWHFFGRFHERYEALIPFLVCAVLVTVTINATRAGILPAILFAFAIFAELFRRKPFRTGFSLLSIFLIGAVSVGVMSSQYIDRDQERELYLQQRFTENDDHRIKSSLRSLTNFYENPFIGVGMLYAAGEKKVGIVNTEVDDARSNNQYAQNLGAGGLLLFLVWMATYYRLYFWPLVRKSSSILVGISLYLVYFHLFQRPAPWMGIYAFLLYVVTIQPSYSKQV